jgi:hypothetical protein
VGGSPVNSQPREQNSQREQIGVAGYAIPQFTGIHLLLEMANYGTAKLATSILKIPCQSTPFRIENNLVF